MSAPSSFTSAHANGRSSGCVAQRFGDPCRVLDDANGATSTISESRVAACRGRTRAAGTSTCPVAVRTPTTRRSRKAVRNAPITGPTLRRYGNSSFQVAAIERESYPAPPLSFEFHDDLVVRIGADVDGGLDTALGHVHDHAGDHVGLHVLAMRSSGVGLRLDRDAVASNLYQQVVEIVAVHRAALARREGQHPDPHPVVLEHDLRPDPAELTRHRCTLRSSVPTDNRGGARDRRRDRGNRLRLHHPLPHAARSRLRRARARRPRPAEDGCSAPTASRCRTG